MSGHKTEADTATETVVEEKKGKWDQWRRRRWYRGGSPLTSQRAHEPKCMKEVEANIYIYYIFFFFFKPNVDMMAACVGGGLLVFFHV